MLKRAAYPHNTINDKDFLVRNFGLRFGFNGQEKDDDVAGVGNIMTATFWEYDARLGRRWNLDPHDQISISNYAVNGLNPILFNDPNGDLFGIKGFGSTSEQRKAARSFAKENQGEVHNLLQKSINVTYQKSEKILKMEKTDDPDVPLSAGYKLTDKTQFFNEDGSNYDDRPSIRTNTPCLMDTWSESKGLLGSASYNIANSLYTTPQLFTQPFTGGFYNLNGTEQVRGSSELIGNFTMGVSSFVPTGSGLYAMGPLKNWIRMGSSYSIEGGFKTYAIRWGAGGNYWKNIPSTTLQGFNRSLRQTKIPIDNWRTVDPGHFHLFKK